MSADEERRPDHPLILAKLDRMEKSFEDWQREVRTMFHGDSTGAVDRPGLMVRVDRLEQRAAGNRKLIMTLITAVIAIAGELVARLFGKGL